MKRSKVKYFIFLFAVCAAFFVVWFFSTQRNSDEHLIVMPNAFEDISCDKNQVLSSSTEALNHILCDSFVKETLTSFQRDAKYKSWRVLFEKLEHKNEWRAQIQSQGVIPSASCLLTINALGQVTIVRACEYNK